MSSPSSSPPATLANTSLEEISKLLESLSARCKSLANQTVPIQLVQELRKEIEEISKRINIQQTHINKVETKCGSLQLKNASLGNDLNDLKVESQQQILNLKNDLEKEKAERQKAILDVQALEAFLTELQERNGDLEKRIEEIETRPPPPPPLSMQQITFEIQSTINPISNELNSLKSQIESLREAQSSQTQLPSTSSHCQFQNIESEPTPSSSQSQHSEPPSPPPSPEMSQNSVSLLKPTSPPTVPDSEVEETEYNGDNGGAEDDLLNELITPPAAMKIPRPILARLVLHGVDTNSELKCICGDNFQSKSSLTEHIRLYTTESKFCCPVFCCSKVFRRLNSLGVHVLKVHGGKLDRYQRIGCRTCGGSFTSNKEFKYHLRTCTVLPANDGAGTDDVDYAIPIIHGKLTDVSEATASIKCYCGAEFLVEGDFDKHFEEATSPNLLNECKTCGKMLETKDALEDHMLKEHKTLSVATFFRPVPSQNENAGVSAPGLTTTNQQVSLPSTSSNIGAPQPSTSTNARGTVEDTQNSGKKSSINTFYPTFRIKKRKTTD